MSFLPMLRRRKAGVSNGFVLGVDSGITSLSRSLTINGATVEPTFWFNGQDANASTWAPEVGAETLDIALTGDAPTLGLYTPVADAVSRGVKFNAGTLYEGDGALANVGTDDFVIEAVIEAPVSTSSQYVFGNVNASFNAGWALFCSSSHIILYMTRSGGSVSCQVSRGVGTHEHVIFFVDRSGSMVGYRNAAAGTATTPNTVDDSSDPFQIGGGNNAGQKYTGKIIQLAMWQADDWLDTHLQASVAKERAAKIMGVYANNSYGSGSPSVMTRASGAYTDRVVSAGVRQLFLCGNGWMRKVDRLNDSAEAINGFLSESQRTNLCLQSAAFGTTWTTIDAGDTVSADASTAPDMQVTADAIIGDSTDGQHGVTQNITLTAAAYTMSVFAKAGDNDFVVLENATIANGAAWFDLSTGSVGTTQAGVSATIEDWGDGWFRLSITFTGTAAAHTLQILSAAADNDDTFAGDGAAVNMTLWGAQVELGSKPTSYIPTTTATATRIADVLTYDITGNGLTRGTLAAKHVISGTEATFAAEMANGAASERVVAYQTGGKAATLIAAGGVTQASITGSTDVNDGVEHETRVTYAEDDVTLYVDGTSEGTPDTSGTAPAGLTRLYVGASNASTFQANSPVYGVQLYNKPTLKGT
jgi:hypothetical protein